MSIADVLLVSHLSTSCLTQVIAGDKTSVSQQQINALISSGLMKQSYGNRSSQIFRTYQQLKVVGNELLLPTKHGLKLILYQEAWADLVDSMLWQLGASQADPSGDVVADVSDVMTEIERLNICTDGRQWGITRNYVADRLAEAYAPQMVRARHQQHHPQGQQPPPDQPTHDSQHASHLVSCQKDLAFMDIVMAMLLSAFLDSIHTW